MTVGAPALLVKLAGVLPASHCSREALASLADAAGLPRTSISAHVALDGTQTYVYLRQSGSEPLASTICAVVREASRGALSTPEASIEVVRLEPIADLRGVSFGEVADYHYVVETDVEPYAASELNDWYHREHLPGLAAVPGNVRARRMLDLDGAPRSYASYDLQSTGVLASEAWLAVRGTAWSDRVRPSFRNTKRTMFRTVVAESPG